MRKKEQGKGEEKKEKKEEDQVEDYDKTSTNRLRLGARRGVQKRRKKKKKKKEEAILLSCLSVSLCRIVMLTYTCLQYSKDWL